MMFKKFIEIGMERIEISDFMLGVMSFFVIAIGGVIIGLVFGFIVSFITKFLRFSS